MGARSYFVEPHPEVRDCARAEKFCHRSMGSEAWRCVFTYSDGLRLGGLKSTFLNVGTSKIPPDVAYQASEPTSLVAMS